MFHKTQSSSEGRIGALVGRTATVITPIPASGVGEIAYVQGGSRYTAPAREQNGVAVANGQTVKITRIAESQFFVSQRSEKANPSSTPQPKGTECILHVRPFRNLGGLGTVVLAVVGLVFVLFLIMPPSGPAATPRLAPTRSWSSPATNTNLWRRMARAISRFPHRQGRRHLRLPVLEKVDVLSLELLTIDVQTPEVYTSKGVPVKVDGVAQIKIKGDDVSIATASEQVLSKTIDEIKSVATQTWKAICAPFSAP
jgi:hypothetical protein